MTRGRGVAVHRASCSNLRELSGRSPERVIPVAWGSADASRLVLYPVDVNVEASDRQGLLRDVSEVFAKEKMNVTGVKTQSVRDGGAGTAFMTFTVEVADATRLAAALAQVLRVPAFARRDGGSAVALAGVGGAARSQRTGIGVARSTGTAVTLFCGEPSITRSE